jgi:hypothetical protein
VQTATPQYFIVYNLEKLSEMKKMKNILSTFTVLTVLLMTLSCNKSSELGADLFEGEKLNADFTDNLEINAFSEALDSVLMYSSSTAPVDSLLVGDIADPVFGRTESRIYCQFTTTSNILPDFSKMLIDSANVELIYSPTRVYGDTTKIFNMGVYRLAETFPTDNIFSNKRIREEPTALKKVSFFPQPTTTITDVIKTVNESGTSTTFDTLSLSPRVRVALDKSFTNDLSKWDTTRLKNFITEFKGLELRAESTTEAMVNFNFGSTSATGIYIYYREVGDTSRKRKTYIFPITISHFANFKHTYSSGTISTYVNNTAKNDRLFLQGMAGPNVRIEFPNIKNLGKVVINKAEIEFTVVPDAKSDILKPIDQLLIRNAQQSPIDDLLLDNNYPISSTTGRSQNRMTTAGGYPRTVVVDGETLTKYYFNVSAHLQGILDGKRGNSLYITPHFKQEKGSRVVFYGAKAPKYRAKLNVYYTKL